MFERDLEIEKDTTCVKTSIYIMVLSNWKLSVTIYKKMSFSFFSDPDL